MQSRVKRVVYPRTDFSDNTGWIFHLAPAFDPATLADIEPHDAITGHRRRFDVRRDTTEHTGWISEFAEKSEYALPASVQVNQGFIQPKRNKLSLSTHAPWQDSGAWMFHQVPVSTYTASLFPAIDAQTQSFRSQRQRRFRQVRTGTPRPGFNTALWPIFEQQLHSYRSLARSKFSFAYHNWQDDQAAIFNNVPVIQPFNAAFSAAINSLAGLRTLEPRLRKRGLDLLWNAHSRSVAALFEDVEILAAITSQQLDSFRLRNGRRLNPIHWFQDQDGWLSYAEIVFNVAEQTPARDQLAEYLTYIKRKRYDPNTLDYNDTYGWLFTANVFDGTLWPSIESLIHSYRQPDRTKTDVRRLDLPHDGWISYNPTIELPLWTGAFITEIESFRMPNRRRTLDTLRVEDFHDFAWLRAVLDLVDAEFGIPRAHWRRIEGAIRSRRRRRRGR